MSDNKPLVIVQPMIGANIAIMVQAIHDATLKGYVPVPSQCHNYFGSLTITMIKKEGEVGEQSVSQSGSNGNSETTNTGSGEEDREPTESEGSEKSTGVGGDADTASGQPDAEGKDNGDTGGISTESGGGSTEDVAKPKVKSTRKTTQSK